MRVEIISTGTELLLGEIINTSVVYLSEKLNQMGYSVLYQTTVGDNEERMKEVYSNALKRADIVITTGGLGPTEGDITKHVMAELLEKSLLLDTESLNRIEAIFHRRNSKMSQNNTRQALIPEDGEAIRNDHGTAPGVWIETEDKKIIIQLPGPPFELKKMFEDQVCPRLEKRFGILGQIFSVSLQTIGISESALAEELHDLISKQTNPTIALLSNKKNQGIRIRLTAKGKSHDEAADLIVPLEAEIRSRLKDVIWGIDDESLARKIGEKLMQCNETLAISESCTAGLLGYQISGQPGSSKYFLGGTICYSNEVKLRDCGVCEETLAQVGAVSSEVAGEMAVGISKHFQSDWGIGITGIAGPDGSTAEKPLGLVYIGIWHRDWNAPEIRKFIFNGERDQVRQRAVQNGLFFMFQKMSG